jgi:hypothetical protein
MFTDYTTTINSLVSAIDTAQTTFEESNNKYFQILKTGTIGTLGSFTFNSPQEIPDIDFDGELPFQLEVHEHWRDEEIGYTIILRGVDDGKNYVKTIGRGIGQTNDWVELIEDEI